MEASSASTKVEEKTGNRRDTRGQGKRERGREGWQQRDGVGGRVRETLCFDAIIIRGLFPATVHSTFVSDVEHPYRPRTGDHTQWALSYLPLKFGTRFHAN